MTRVQLTAVAVLSLLATVLVLVGASAHNPDLDLAKLASQSAPKTIAAAPLASSDPVEDASVADESSTSGIDVSSGADVAADTDTDETPSEADDEETNPDTEDPGATPAEPKPTKIKHVFVIALAGHGFDATFGAGSVATYLNGTLRPQGALLENYSSLGRADLPDHLALVGGQPPNADTRAGCPTFKEIPPTNVPSKAGVIAAAGCVFPNTVTTLGDQLSASRRSWRAYVEDLEQGPAGKATCRHPESNGPDDTIKARAGDGYATRHNPFVYFHSLLDLGDCDANDGALTELEQDLRTVKDTASFSYVVPNLCNDGTESPCVDGSPGGLAAADAFLTTWVPKILASPAYKADGLLIVTFAGDVTPPADPAAAPATDAPVRNGALLVSRFARAGSTAGAAYDPYSLLRSVEDLFALRPLAKAADATSFAPTVLGDAYEAPANEG
ncbi:MAG: alkaline phosphatase family protein [Conexibacter sp.]